MYVSVCELYTPNYQKTSKSTPSLVKIAPTAEPSTANQQGENRDNDIETTTMDDAPSDKTMANHGTTPAPATKMRQGRSPTVSVSIYDDEDNLHSRKSPFDDDDDDADPTFESATSKLQQQDKSSQQEPTEESIRATSTEPTYSASKICQKSPRLEHQPQQQAKRRDLAPLLVKANRIGDREVDEPKLLSPQPTQLGKSTNSA
jgi:hypothetical protein